MVVEAERGGDHVTLISGPADRDWGIRAITLADRNGLRDRLSMSDRERPLVTLG